MDKNYLVYLSKSQLEELATNGQITVGGVTIYADEDMTYGVPDDDYTNQQIDDKVNGVKTIVGTTDPTSSTVGFVGQSYLNSVSGKTFQCKAIAEEGGVTTYTWEAFGGGAPDVDGITIEVNDDDELQAIGLTDGTDSLTFEDIYEALSIERTVS